MRSGGLIVVITMIGLLLSACSDAASDSFATGPTPVAAPAAIAAPAPIAVPAPLPAPSPSPAPAAAPVLLSLSVGAASVVAQAAPTGTVTLSGPAPAAGAVVVLESNNVDVARVPPAVTVAAGLTSASFTVTTATVFVSRIATIRARYANVELPATLRVTPPVPRAAFTVRSPTRGANACEVADNGAHLDCTFDGRASEGRLTRWSWRYTVASTTLTEARAEGELVTPDLPGCWVLNSPSFGVDASGHPYLELRVTLRVEDGDASADESPTQIVRLYPNHQCDWGS